MFKSLNEHPLFKLRSESIHNDEDRPPQNTISNQSQLIKKQNNNVFISFDELYKPVDGLEKKTIKSKQAQQNLIPPTASLARSNENLLAVKCKNSIKQKSSSVSNLNESSIINSQPEPANEFNMNMIESNNDCNNAAFVHAKSTENMNANFSKSLRLNGYLMPVDRDDEQTFPFPLPVDGNLIKSKTDLSLNESLDDSSASSSSQKTPFYVNSNHDYLVSGVEFLFIYFSHGILVLL